MVLKNFFQISKFSKKIYENMKNPLSTQIKLKYEKNFFTNISMV